MLHSTSQLLPDRTLQIRITQPGLIYRLGKGIGAIKVLGLADTGKKADVGAGVIYNNCYLEGAFWGAVVALLFVY